MCPRIHNQASVTLKPPLWRPHLSPPKHVRDMRVTWARGGEGNAPQMMRCAHAQPARETPHHQGDKQQRVLVCHFGHPGEVGGTPLKSLGSH